MLAREGGWVQGAGDVSLLPGASRGLRNGGCGRGDGRLGGRGVGGHLEIFFLPGWCDVAI